MKLYIFSDYGVFICKKSDIVYANLLIKKLMLIREFFDTNYLLL